MRHVYTYQIRPSFDNKHINTRHKTPHMGEKQQQLASPEHLLSFLPISLRVHFGSRAGELGVFLLLFRALYVPFRFTFMAVVVSFYLSCQCCFVPVIYFFLSILLLLSLVSFHDSLSPSLNVFRSPALAALCLSYPVRSPMVGWHSLST